MGELYADAVVTLSKLILAKWVDLDNLSESGLEDRWDRIKEEIFESLGKEVNE